MPTTRAQILDGALDILDEGGSLSLDSAARRAGVTKPGLMYHFPTKEALMLAVVDHVVDRWESELLARLDVPVEHATPQQRLHVYLDWSLSGQFAPGDLAALADPRLRAPLRERYVERMAHWLAYPSRTPAEVRTRLTVVRMIADGAWFADASGIFPLTAAERRNVRRFAAALLEQL